MEVTVRCDGSHVSVSRPYRHAGPLSASRKPCFRFCRAYVVSSCGALHALMTISRQRPSARAPGRDGNSTVAHAFSQTHLASRSRRVAGEGGPVNHVLNTSSEGWSFRIQVPVPICGGFGWTPSGVSRSGGSITVVGASIRPVGQAHPFECPGTMSMGRSGTRASGGRRWREWAVQADRVLLECSSGRGVCVACVPAWRACRPACLPAGSIHSRSSRSGNPTASTGRTGWAVRCSSSRPFTFERRRAGRAYGRGRTRWLDHRHKPVFNRSVRSSCMSMEHGWWASSGWRFHVFADASSARSIRSAGRAVFSNRVGIWSVPGRA